MNKELIVTLLRKNIHELDQLTSGFDEMDRIPSSILLLAKEKMADITVYLEQLNAPASPVEKDMIADIKPVEKIPPIVTVTVETEKPKVEPTHLELKRRRTKTYKYLEIKTSAFFHNPMNNQRKNRQLHATRLSLSPTIRSTLPLEAQKSMMFARC